MNPKDLIDHRTLTTHKKIIIKLKLINMMTPFTLSSVSLFSCFLYLSCMRLEPYFLRSFQNWFKDFLNFFNLKWLSDSELFELSVHSEHRLLGCLIILCYLDIKPTQDKQGNKGMRPDRGCLWPWHGSRWGPKFNRCMPWALRESK